jgi:hypothetical protein
MLVEVPFFMCCELFVGAAWKYNPTRGGLIPRIEYIATYCMIRTPSNNIVIDMILVCY